MTAWVLLFHLSTWSTNGGMSLASAEFTTKAKCEAAGKAAQDKFSGPWSRPYWLCVEK